MTFQHCLRNLQPIHFNTRIYPCNEIWWFLHETSGPSYIWKPDKVRSTKYCLQFVDTIRERGTVVGLVQEPGTMNVGISTLVPSSGCSTNLFPCTCTYSNSLTPSPHTYIRTTRTFGWDCLLSDVCKSFNLCINGKQTDCRFY